MKYLVLLSLACALVRGQNGPDVTLTEDSPRSGITTLDFFDGSGNLVYECHAGSVQPLFRFSVANGRLTSIVVATNVATVTTATPHGLRIDNPVVVSGSATPAINGTFIIASVPSTTTFTYAVTVADGTYNDAAIETSAPRSSASIWTISKQYFSGSNRTVKQWTSGGARNAICDNRTSLSYQ